MMTNLKSIVPTIRTCDRDLAVTTTFVSSYVLLLKDHLAKPVVSIDTTSTEPSQPYLDRLQLLDPQLIKIHPKRTDLKRYDCIQENAYLTLKVGTEVIDDNEWLLFLEDDLLFSSQFIKWLKSNELDHNAGMYTLYHPQNGYNRVVDPNRFYGSQCMLIPAKSAKLLVENKEWTFANIRPGYDLRIARTLGHFGKKIYAADHSYVQHISPRSALFTNADHKIHTSNRFVR